MAGRVQGTVTAPPQLAKQVAGLNFDEKLISRATTMKTQSIRTATTTLLLLSNRHTTRRIVSAAAFFSSSVLLLARAFSSSSSSSVFARSLRITHHSSCQHHHRWSFLSTRGGSGSVASPTSSSYLSSSVSTSSSLSSSTIISSTTPMDQVRASASAKTAAEKLIAMRGKMEEYGVDVYLVPSDDPHLSEYVPAAYMRRGYLTNFHGSAGTALVMSTGKAYLWTDSRYFNEAALSLDPEHWILMRQNEVNVPTIAKFLVDAAIEHYARNAGIPLKVGLDAYVHSSDFAKELTDAFVEGAKDVLVIDDDRESSAAVVVNGHDRSVPPVIAVLETLDGKSNIVDSIWDGRPALPKNPFVVHPIEYAGLSVADKVDKIRAEMKDRKATLVVLGALDDIAYLFNVRCMNDVETCPVGIAYATISRDVVTLYCDDEKVTPADVAMHLLSSNVVVRPYEDVVEDVRAHLRSDPTKSKVWLDGSRSNYALGRVIPMPNRIDAQNPIAVMKSVKNDAEMEGMRRAHIVDGAAMAEFMAWLEHAIVIEGRSDVSEVEVDLVLTGCRAKQPGFKEVSFPTIAGCGSNGAIVHYRAAFGSDLLKYVSKTAPILIDSGGQYEYGTTDVTRTWFFGDTPSDDFKEAYTRVLKGNIGVDTMIFPENTPGFVLDVFARKALWEVGLDYGHGTGHGVGAALNVHEGPHSISPRWLNKEVLKRGMVTSNEPGYYEDGNFGVRIENLLEIVDANPPTTSGDDAETAHPPVAKKQRIEGGGKKFLKFTRLTQIPIQKDLIKLDIMTKTELDWLDAYHEEVLKKVAPLLEEGSPSMKWLVKSCEKIERH